ncbi:hypothetical protein Taro_042417 [Colocasia esculenta]|uniref:Uncharacterized protein n=1 Tax=Colocasia esculenta TaxID=4460 RepID=A0A843WWF9_COLES|nr:hypothetical protein [Colocasia esculenta]
MYMDVDDRVFVPPSGVYMVMSTFVLPMGCLCLHRVTCLHVCRFMTPEDLNMCLYVYRFMTPEDLNICLYVCRFMTPEDLNMANGGLATTCGVSVRASAGGLDHEDKAPTGVENLSRHVRPMGVPTNFWLTGVYVYF